MDFFLSEEEEQRFQQYIHYAQYVQYASNGYYIGLWPGVSLGVNPENLRLDNDALNLFASIPYRIHFIPSLRFGRKLGSVRSEIELTYGIALGGTLGSRNKDYNVRIPNTIYVQNPVGAGRIPVEIDGNFTVTSIGPLKQISVSTSHLGTIACNFYYDFIETFGPLTPNVGAGIGYIKRYSTIKNNLDGTTKKENDGNILIQVMTGMEYHLKKQFSLGVEIKYVMLPDGSIGLKRTFGNLGFKSVVGHLRFSIGATYRFF